MGREGVEPSRSSERRILSPLPAFERKSATAGRRWLQTHRLMKVKTG
jgi:hypothetical protein